MSIGFPIGLGIFGILFSVMSLAIVGLFVFILVKAFSAKQKNDSSPILTTPATVVTKRT